MYICRYIEYDRYVLLYLQRIEQWWGRLRVEVLQPYINLLQGMEDHDMFNSTNAVHRY